MINIKDLLKRFSQIRNPREQKEIIARIITQITKIPVSTDQINIKNNIVRTFLASTYKNKAFIYKEKILQELKNTPELADTVIKDILF